MKNSIIIILCLSFLIGCNLKKSTKIETAEKYFNARNSADFDVIRNLISDSLTIIEGDYKMDYSLGSFYEVFKWDSVFQTTYEIIDIQQIDKKIKASIALSSIRNKFLKNERMTCKYILSFKDEKISIIESLDCENANWEIWENQVNSLVNWIEENHPELNGFIYDMTMNGAKNYVRAINLFESKESKR